ncbi:MAG: MotA/TolQ/ExbB proton channel family protein [Candidatus Cloacimonetes bacterium]|nr:MotA/TolQ/ExbB proton channel family protein [Candidatus Cloacimonadota bacterium]
MYILLVVSMIAVTIVIRKYRQLSQIRRMNNRLNDRLHQQDRLDNMAGIIKVYGQESPLGIMLGKLFLSTEADLPLLRERMEASAAHEIHNLEKGYGWLSTFAAVAPLIGFLGTVMGMVRVFMNIQTQSTSGVDINILAGGIWEALLTTIGGLIVGIIAIIFYNDLVQRLEDLTKEMQEQAMEYLVRYTHLKQKDR